MKSHGDGSVVVEEGANCMHDWLQKAQNYYRDQFAFRERKWYNHLLSQAYLADPFKITDNYTHKWSKSKKLAIELWLLHSLLSVKGDF